MPEQIHNLKHRWSGNVGSPRCSCHCVIILERYRNEDDCTTPIRLLWLTLASLPACGCAEPSFTAFFESRSGASEDFIITALTLLTIPPLPALEVLSRSEFATFTASLSFLPSEPLRRKTSKSVGRLFGDAIPKRFKRVSKHTKTRFLRCLTVNSELVCYAILAALSSFKRSRSAAKSLVTLR